MKRCIGQVIGREVVSSLAHHLHSFDVFTNLEAPPNLSLPELFSGDVTT